MTLSVIPIEGIGEIRPGDELAVLIADAARAQGTPLADGDCLVVTQKIVSKAEDRLVPLDPDDLDARRALVESESVRIVRRRGDLIISETRHGFVCANAGIDLSNVEHGWAALLPGRLRPFGQAHPRRAAGRGSRSRSPSIVSDTFGRPWRRGLTDVAIGVSGIAAVVDLRDTTDALGRVLQVTEVAVADEIASAAELVMGKATERSRRDRARLRPRLVARGLRARADPARPTRTCSGESTVPAFVEARRSIRAFLPDVPPRADLDAIVEAACLAPAPHHSRPWRFVVVDTDDGQATRSRTAWASAGAATSLADGVAPDRVDELVDASHAKLVRAPAFVVGCLTWNGLDRYPDERRQRAEWGMALLSLGAAVENLMLAATDRGLASCWVAAPIFCPEEARDALALPDGVAAARARAGRHARPRVRRPGAASRSPRRDPRAVRASDRATQPQRVSRRSLALKCSSVRARPSSSGVNGFQPRWISALPGIERAALELAGAGRLVRARARGSR